MHKQRKNLSLAFFVLISAGWSGVSALAGETIRIGGDGSAVAVMQVLEAHFKKKQPDIQLILVPGLSSGGARKALPAGALDVAVTSRPGNVPEDMPGAEVNEYGKAPFVFVTSTANSAQSLTLADLVDFYAGKKVSWPNGERLRVILRPQTDSDTAILKSISPAMADALTHAHSRDGLKIAITDLESADLVAATPGGLGTSTLALILAQKRPLKPLTIENRTPSQKTLADGSYPWFKTYYVSVKPDAPSAARKFVDFLISPSGKELLLSLGHRVSN